MRWPVPIAAVALVAAVVAIGQDGGGPTLREPFPFHHGAHTAGFEATGVTCVGCHPVGLHVGEGEQIAPPEGGDLKPALLTCHGCHLQAAKGMPVDAPNRCSLCHDPRSGLIPPSHDAQWMAGGHGIAAMADVQACTTCHDPGGCSDCHEVRGPVTTNPHPAGFSRTHGVQARIDPASCTECHAGDVCSTCHGGGVQPW